MGAGWLSAGESPVYLGAGGAAWPPPHRDHLCHLMEKGLTEEVRRRSDRPGFLCANCGARANAAVDLCNPGPLKP